MDSREQAIYSGFCQVSMPYAHLAKSRIFGPLFGVEGLLIPWQTQDTYYGTFSKRGRFCTELTKESNKWYNNLALCLTEAH